MATRSSSLEKVLCKYKWQEVLCISFSWRAARQHIFLIASYDLFAFVDVCALLSCASALCEQKQPQILALEFAVRLYTNFMFNVIY